MAAPTPVEALDLIRAVLHGRAGPNTVIDTRPALAVIEAVIAERDRFVARAQAAVAGTEASTADYARGWADAGHYVLTGELVRKEP